MAGFERTYPISEIVGELLPAGLSPEAFAVSLAWDAAAREGIHPQVGRPLRGWTCLSPLEVRRSASNGCDG